MGQLTMKETADQAVNERLARQDAKAWSAKCKNNKAKQNINTSSSKETLFLIGVLVIIGVVSTNIILSGNGSSLLDLLKSL